MKIEGLWGGGGEGFNMMVKMEIRYDICFEL